MNDPIMIGGTVTSRVAAQLREDIFSKKIEAGSHISIQEIADKYGISKTPVREAFRTLEGERLLKFNAYRGATVLEIDRTYICEVYELLRVLNSYLSETALSSIGESELKSLREINQTIQDIQDGKVSAERYVALDDQFHEIFFQRSTNATARDLYETYRRITRSLRGSYRPWPERIGAVVDEHAALIRAVEKRDPTALREAISTHVMNALANFLKQYEQDN